MILRNDDNIHITLVLPMHSGTGRQVGQCFDWCSENEKDFNEQCSLMNLLMPERLDGFDFGCRQSKELLQRQYNWINDNNLTVSMILCHRYLQLLSYDWDEGLVQR